MKKLEYFKVVLILPGNVLITIPLIIFLLLFETILFSSMPIFFWFLIFFIGNIFYFKNVEEKDLIKRFGEDYTNYRDKVKMFIPSFSRYNNKQ